MSGGRTRFQWKEKHRYPLWMGGPVGGCIGKPIVRRVWRRNLRNLQQRF